MNKLILLLGLCILIALYSAGCTQTNENTSSLQGSENETGKIYVSGAFALYPMMITWSEEYQKIHPGITFEISAGGAGKGMTDALSGMVDIGMVSREIHPEEEEQGACFVAVTRDAVLGTINNENPSAEAILSRGITRSDLKKIYIEDSVTNWGQLSGLEGTDTIINRYTRSDACGAADVWADYIGGYNQEDLGGTAVFGDPGLADAVGADPFGFGYNNVNYAYDPTSSMPVRGITILPLDLNQNGMIDSDEDFYTTRADLMDAIATGIYPSPPARDLYFVTKDSFSGPTKKFVEWVLSDGQQFVTEAGYIPLAASMLQKELDTIV